MSSSPRTSTASATPVFESKGQAEQKLRAVYQQYIRSANVVYSGGSSDLERLASLVTPAQLDREEESLGRFREIGTRISGGASVAEFELQSVDLRSGAAKAYACLDVSKSRVLDASGNDVTPDVRPARATWELTFLHSKLDMSEPWSGSSIC